MSPTQRANKLGLQPPGSETPLRQRVAAIGLAAAYVAVVFALTLAGSAALKAATGRTLAQNASGAIGSALAAQVTLLLAVLLPVAVLALLRRRGPAEFGWDRRASLKYFLTGLAAGLAGIGAIALGLTAGGWLTLRPAGEALSSMAPWLSGWALIWLVQAAQEEALFRGYGLTQLSRGVGFWPAAILSSLVFMLAHAGNGGESSPGLLGAGLLGLALAYSRKRTGSLWLAWGFHAAWNFAQSTLLGTANSGALSARSLLHASISGPAWLTGGEAGLEGSLAILFVAAGVVMAARLATPRGGDL